MIWVYATVILAVVLCFGTLHVIAFRNLRLLNHDMAGVIQRFSEAGISVQESLQTSVTMPTPWVDTEHLSDEDIDHMRVTGKLGAFDANKANAWIDTGA